MIFMPSHVQMIVLAIAAAAICGWAGLVLQEKNGDEREVSHRMHAGRAAYLSGVLVLTIALIYQGLTHNIDMWVPISLATMIVSKGIARYVLEARA